MNTKLLRQKVLDLAIHGKLLDKAVVEALETTPGYEPASKLLERIRGESDVLFSDISKSETKLVSEATLPLASRVSERNSVVSDSERTTPSAGSNAARNARSNPISEDEIPFEIPKSWCWCRLGILAEVKSSKRVFEKDYVETGIPFYRSKEIGSLSRKESIKDTLFISSTQYNEIKIKYGVPKAGDILITSVGSIGNTWICDEREFYYKDGNLTQIVKNDSFISEYLNFFLHSDSFSSQVSETVGGSAYNALTIEKLNKVRIPLPPLEEQKLIVEEIERIFALIDTVEQNKTDLETVIKQTKSKILDLAIHGKLVPQDKTDEPASILFEKIKKEKQLTDVDEIEELPFEIPSSWKWVHLSDVCLKLKRGKSPKYVEKSSYMAFAQKCNQKDGPTSLEKALYIDETSLNRYPPEEYMQKYDIVINSTGTGTLGRVGIYDCEVPEGIKGVFADSHVTTIHPSSYVNPKYVYYFVKCKQKYLESAGEGSTNQKELKVATIGEMEFPLPPLEEQNQIVIKIESIYDKIDILK